MKIHTHDTGVHKISFVKISELPEEERKPFREWMTGQTCPLIPGEVPGDCVYPWDYQQWKDGLAPLD